MKKERARGGDLCPSVWGEEKRKQSFRTLVANVRHSATRLTPPRVTAWLEDHGVCPLLGDGNDVRVHARPLSAGDCAVVGGLRDEVALEVEHLFIPI